MTAPPRVLHAPVEVAGQSALSAHGLRAIGVEAHSFARRHAFDYPVAPDYVPGPGRLSWLRTMASAIPGHDVFHFYFGQSFLPERLSHADARALRRAGRRVVVEFMGSDVRMPSVEAARNPHYVQLGESDETSGARMRRWSAITGGHAIVCDRGLSVFAERYFEHVHVVPFRVDTGAYVATPPARRPNGAPVVVHAPSSRAGKGTKHVRAAVDSLRGRGIDLEYVEIHGAGQRETVEACARADIVVDQLCSGSHGVFAVEAMAMAKPVVCFVLAELEGAYPARFPIVNADPATLADVLADWLGRPEDRHARGLDSREYAVRVHDVKAVAHKLLDVYSELPGAGRGRR